MSRHTHLSQDHSLESKSRPASEVIRRVCVYLLPYKGMFAGTLACAILSLAFSFVFPKMTQVVVDEVIDKGRADILPYAMLALIGAFFLSDLFNSLRIRINNTFEQNVIYDMRREIYARLQRLPAHYFDQRASGDLMTRVIEDVNSVERLLIDGTEQGTLALLSIVGVLFILFRENTTLAWVALVPLPLLAGGALWYTTTAHRRYRKQRIASSAMNSLLMDNLQGVRQIKIFGRESHEDNRFAARADDLREGTLGVMRVWSIYSPAMNFIAYLGFGLVLWVGGRHVLAGTMTKGELIGFVLYLRLFYDPIGKLHGLNQMLQSARSSAERVFDILDHPAERANQSAQDVQRAWPARFHGEVVYDKVSFQYDADKPVLHEISLHARPGEMIALVGPTGAGKSTIVNLLAAFYELTSGRVTIDGHDIREMPLDVLRAQISIVSQEAFLFNGTIKENILYGDLDATNDQMIAAAKAANCHEFIMRLPQGYDSRVGERGVKLSVGEKQRVSIARALLKNSPILILDEATASVDTVTEKLIQQALERLMAGRTTFVIAHRLSTIRRAHQILVIKNGQIIERGSHEELLSADGLYAKLARIQNTTFIEEGFAKLEPTETTV
jgi:ATP-binding cassette subfamily B protein